MPSTSYLRENIYAVDQFHPYEMPYQAVMQSIATRTDYWKKGVDQIRSRYSDATNLPLTTEINIKRRNDFVNKADEQIQKLSVSDISIPDNVQGIVSVFNPLFKDKDIIGENYLTNQWTKGLSEAEDSRTKEGGKYYNPTSVNLISTQKEVLKKANGQQSWKNILNAGVASYNPYHDVSAELANIMKTLKEEEITQDRALSDFQIQEIKSKGVSKDRVLAAISEIGSPQLQQSIKEQAQLAFYSRFLNSPETLDNYYQTLSNNLYDSQIRDYSNQKSENQYNLWKTPQSETAKRRQYSSNISAIDGIIGKLQKDKATDQKKYTNLSDFNSLPANIYNATNLASTIDIDNLASKLAYKSESSTLQLNAGGAAAKNYELAQNKFSYERSRDIIEDKKWKLEFDQKEREIKAKKEEDAAKTALDRYVNTGGVKPSNVNSTTTPTPEEALGALNQKFSVDGGRLEIANAYISTLSPGTVDILNKNPNQTILLSAGASLAEQFKPIAELFKAVALKNKRSVFINGKVYTSDDSIETFMEAIKNSTGSKLKEDIGKTLYANKEVTNDALNTILANDPSKKTTVLAVKKAFDDYDGFMQEYSESIAPKIKNALGDKAELFERAIKGIHEKDPSFASSLSNLAWTTQNINRILNTIIPETGKSIKDSMNLYFKNVPVYSGMTSLFGNPIPKFDNVKKERITEEEFNKGMKEQVNNTFVGERFNSQYEKVSVDANQLASVVLPLFSDVNMNQGFVKPIYLSGKEVENREQVQRMIDIAAKGDTDSKKTKILNFAQAHPESVNSINLFSVDKDNKTPSFNFSFSNKGLSETEVNELKSLDTNVRIEALQGSFSQEFYNPASKFIDKGHRGAVISHFTQRDKSVSILNNSSEPNVVEPIVVSKGDVYIQFPFPIVLNEGTKDETIITDPIKFDQFAYNKIIYAYRMNNPQRVIGMSDSEVVKNYSDEIENLIRDLLLNTK